MAKNQIFLVGSGRSGLLMNTFAMRLMHLGFEANVIGSPVTPSAKKEDLVLVASGSGETNSVIASARQAKEHNVKVGLITSAMDSTLANIADEVLELPTLSQISDDQEFTSHIQPLGSSYEQALFLILEGLISYLKKKKSVSEEEMSRRHTNLE